MGLKDLLTSSRITDTLSFVVKAAVMVSCFFVDFQVEVLMRTAVFVVC